MIGDISRSSANRESARRHSQDTWSTPGATYATSSERPMQERLGVAALALLGEAFAEIGDEDTSQAALCRSLSLALSLHLRGRYSVPHTRDVAEDLARVSRPGDREVFERIAQMLDTCRHAGLRVLWRFIGDTAPLLAKLGGEGGIWRVWNRIKEVGALCASQSQRYSVSRRMGAGPPLDETVRRWGCCPPSHWPPR